MPPSRAVRVRPHLSSVFPREILASPKSDSDETLVSASDISSLTGKPKSSRNHSIRNTLKISSTFRHSPDTDLILQASDFPFTFHISSKILFGASPVLADQIRALGFGKPASIVEVGGPEEVIQLDEEAEIIDAILRFAYPKVKNPAVKSIEHLDRLLAATNKYQVEAGRHALGQLVIGLADKSPLTAYAIACRHDLLDEARMVSKSTLNVDLSKADLTFDFAGVPAPSIRRLVLLHNTRSAAAQALVTECRTSEFFCRGCQDTAQWFEIFREYAKIELKVKPCTQEIFSPRFLAGCLRKASKTCGYCVDNYMSAKAQLALAVLQNEIDVLDDRI